jgi:hypothetical protein
VQVNRSCARATDGYACRVEFVPDGTRVLAQSDAPVAGGDWVEVRIWHDVVSGTDTYRIVR